MIIQKPELLKMIPKRLAVDMPSETGVAWVEDIGVRSSDRRPTLVFRPIPQEYPGQNPEKQGDAPDADKRETPTQIVKPDKSRAGKRTDFRHLPVPGRARLSRQILLALYQPAKIFSPGTKMPPTPIPIKARPTPAMNIFGASPKTRQPRQEISVKIVTTRRGPIVSDNRPTGGWIAA